MDSNVMKYYVYAYQEKESDSFACYIGASSTWPPEVKLATEWSVATARGAFPHTHFQEWMRELHDRGIYPHIQVLEQFPDKATAAMGERRWIARGRELGWPLRNSRRGAGQGGSGLK